MSFHVDFAFLLKCTGQLVLSVVLASVVGWERELHGRPAGLRTHVLVAIGATLFTIASVHIARGGGDPGRIAAQIVSGIGFLGAGTIIHQGSVVRGLTTAATLWAVAGIGLAVGLGGEMMLVALLATVVVFVTLTILKRVERAMAGHREHGEITITCTDGRGILAKVAEALAGVGAEMRGASITQPIGASPGSMELSIWQEGGLNVRAVTLALTALPEVTSLEWQ